MRTVMGRVRFVCLALFLQFACGALFAEETWSGSTLHNYRAKVVKIVDGDTIDCDIDVGFHVTIRERLRLLWINAPEVKGATKQAGDAATEHLKGLLDEADDEDGYIQIHTEKPDSFGRYLALIRLGSGTVNQRMIQDGHAVEFKR